MQRILTDLARTLDADDARQHAVIAAREVEDISESTYQSVKSPS